MGDLGGFAGLFRLDTKKYKNPILASSTDGVGTKLVIAQQLDIHDTVGIDLVAMVVDDLVACGAEPLFLLDYIACGEVVPDKVAEIGAGIADGCRYAGCALLGGETAEHPGVLRPDEYDISATGVGVVEENEILSPERVEVGDVVIAMRSSGLHSNGYSLVRHVLLGAGRMRLDMVIDDFGRQRTLGEELLTPTKIYAKDCLKLIAEAEVRALAHVTGGGIPGNLVRVLPEHVDAVVEPLDLEAAADLRPDPVQGPDRGPGDGGDVQHGRRHVRDRLGRGRRPGAGHPDRPGCRRLAGRRDHRGLRATCRWSGSTPGVDHALPIIRAPDRGFTRVATAA